MSEKLNINPIKKIIKQRKFIFIIPIKKRKLFFKVNFCKPKIFHFYNSY